jgi:hypothetical protein
VFGDFPLFGKDMWATLLSPIHSPEKVKVLQAIEGLGSKIVPADVATRTGLPVLKVTAELNQIASETGGHLQVGDAGTIVYQFDPLFQNSYLLNGPRHFFRMTGRLIFNVAAFLARAFCVVMFFLIRVSFGIALILSVVAVIGLIIFAIFRFSNNSDSDSGGGFDFSGLFDFSGGDRPFYLYWAFDWLWDWWYWGGYLFPQRTAPQYRDYSLTDIMNDVYKSRDGKTGGEAKASDFLSNCFTFLFGEGDPNTHLEEARWQTVAEVIKINQGTLTCEQLAPYTGNDPSNEDWMLPILVRFNGSPEVTESGQIIYNFPSFQVRTIGSPANTPLHDQPLQAQPNDGRATLDELRSLYRNQLSIQGGPPPQSQSTIRLDKYLPEETWEFMPISEGSVTWICIWAGLVLCLSAWLMFHLALVHPFVPLVYALFGYGCFFVVAPAVRWFIYEQINNRISARNEKKLEYAAVLANPSRELSSKLESARQMRLAGAPTHAEQIVYTTDKDALEQEFDH